MIYVANGFQADPSKFTRSLELRNRNGHAAALGSLSSLVDTMIRSGEAVEIVYPDQIPRWTPQWVPHGYTHIAWDIISAAEVTWAKEDAEAREIAFASAIERSSRLDDQLLLVYEGCQAFIRMSRSTVLRHSRIILAHERISGSPLWVTSPPDQWLVEVSFDMITVGEPLPVSSGLTELELLQQTLEFLEVPYEVIETPPGHPALPNLPLSPTIPPLRSTVSNDKILPLVRVIREFVVERLASETVVQLIPTGSPRVHISRQDFLANLEELVSRAVTLNVSAPAANWGLSIRRRLERTWIEIMY